MSNDFTAHCCPPVRLQLKKDEFLLSSQPKTDAFSLPSDLPLDSNAKILLTTPSYGVCQGTESYWKLSLGWR